MPEIAHLSACIEPSWLPDETLFSLCSRLHHLSCRGLSADTTRILFGRSRAGSAHDFPTHLDEFSRRTDGHWGDVGTLISQHTIAPYFFPFRLPSNAREAIAAMRGTSARSLKFQLGLLTSRFRANLPLKACPACMRQDKADHCVAYWHLEHQLPTVWICRRHGTPLEESTVKATGVRRFDWCLPDDVPFRPLSGTSQFSDATLSSLLRLADDSVALWASAIGQHFDGAQLSLAYRQRAFELGMCKPNGSPHWTFLAQEYAKAVAPLRVIESLSALPSTSNLCRQEVERFLRTPRAGTHPVRHLVLIGWLFENWQHFLRAYETAAIENDPPRTVAAMPIEQAPDPRREKLVGLISEGRVSVSAAARALDIDTKTAQAWISAAGVEVRRRPKILKPPIREGVVHALRMGEAKASVAQRFGVSITTITTTLRTTVGLHAEWVEAQDTHRRESRRLEWTALLQTHAGAGMKELRALAPACYAWLYRNDRNWLNQSNAGLPVKGHGNHVLVAWDKRDEALSDAVKRISAGLAAGPSGTRIRLGALCQALPELKAKLGKLDRLPLTRRALDVALRPPANGSNLLHAASEPATVTHTVEARDGTD